MNIGDPQLVGPHYFVPRRWWDTFFPHGNCRYCLRGRYAHPILCNSIRRMPDDKRAAW
jgi:hypothetical protein